MNVQTLLVGLGNPGSKYEKTRHNAGFIFLSSFLRYMEKQISCTVSSFSIKNVPAECWKLTINSTEHLVMLPETFMNNSGLAVAPCLHYLKMSPATLCVCHDELDIPFATLRIKKGGSDAGHNGLRSITQQLGTSEYTRFRLGIGRPLSKEYPVIRWVLDAFSKEEYHSFSQFCVKIFPLLQIFCEEGFDATYHTWKTMKV